MASQAKLEPAQDEQTLRQKAKLPVWAQYLQVNWNERGEPVRYRVIHGGRGGAKSRSIATELLLKGTESVERVLCTREYQKSIRDSVKRLLDDEINRLGLGVLGNGFYLSTDKEIRGTNGTLFVFQGLHRNEGGIRSLEGVTICWVEEARFVSQESLDALIPTIRAAHSEIWFSYNPKAPDDPVDAMFRGEDGPPPGSIIIEVNHYDNPWFPDVLVQAMEYDQGRDPERYAHIWLGKFLQRSESKVFHNWKVRPFDVPEDAVLRFGADWGFSVDPTVLVSAFIGKWAGEAWESNPVPDPKGNVLFVTGEAWAVGCPIDDTPALFAGSDEGQPPGRERWLNPNGRPGLPGAHRWRIRADSARPELVAYLKARGFNIESAEKGAGSVEEGVTFLQSYDICVHPSCTHVADELTLYSYKVEKLTNQVLPVLADKDNHCIAEGVLVTCERGLVPIELVSTSDRVLTRGGWRDVLFAGQTDADRDILEVETSIGMVRCTPDHKIWVEGRGMVRADALRYGDKVIGSGQWSSESNGTAGLTAATQKAPCGSIGSIISARLPEGQADSTETYGRAKTGQYRTAGISTISTAIRLITSFRISLVSTQQAMLRSIPGPKSARPRRRSILNASGPFQRLGIAARKALRSIARLEPSPMPTSTQLRKVASNVGESSSRASSDHLTSFALINAVRPREELPESMTSSGLALAERPSSSTDTAGPSLVRGLVRGVYAAGQCKRVYDLTVDGDHEFFANGVLVSNCVDALRYALEAARKAGFGQGKFASAGRRVTLGAQEDPSRGQAAIITRAGQPAEASAPTGKGWGSAPSIRTGLI